MKVNSEGVSSSRIFLPAGQSHANLLDFFASQFPHIEVSEWHARFQEGLVMTLEGKPVAADDPYQPNIHLQYFNIWIDQ